MTTMLSSRAQRGTFGFLVLRVGCDLDLDHLVGIGGRLALLDLVDEFHAGSDLAPYGVLAVEEVRVLEADEELAARTARIAGTGHRGHAATVRLLAEFGGQTITHAAHAVAVGIAGLGHEAVDHAMEHDAVVLAFAGELLDLRYVLGREVGTHLDDDAAVLEVDVERVFLVHGHSLTSAATRTLIILSGLAGGSPFLILSTNSMPDVTLPHTVYWPSRKFESLSTMKNWLCALFGSLVRAMPTAPRENGVLENSACSSEPMPPRPVPCGSPVWAMKPSITRWKTRPSYLPSRASFLICSTCLGATAGSISMTTRPSLRSM